MTKNLASVVTIGTFDGVHRGHQKLIQTAKDCARQQKIPSVALTFSFPPRLLFHPVSEPYLLNTTEEKIFLLRKSGVKKIAVIRFDKNFSNLTAGDFFEKLIIKKFRAKGVVVGYNFRFGRAREGDGQLLKELGKKHFVSVQIIPPLHAGSLVVSSGLIREFLRRGKLGKANQLLGYPYIIIGKVEKGKGLGRKIGFPTANLKISPMKILPHGIYAIKVSLFDKKRQYETGKKYEGVCDIGYNPTIKNLPNVFVSVEAHLFHFAGSLYGKTLKIELIKRLRSEKKFKHIEALKKQIEKDKIRAMNWFRREK